MTWLQGTMLRWHVCLVAIAIPGMTRRLPLSRLLALFTPPGPSRLYAGIGEDEVVRIIHRQMRHPWRMRGRRCLRTGLLLFHFLRLAGAPAVLIFCVYSERKAGREQAHCWVTVAGQCVSDPPEAEHVVILVHGAADRSDGRIAA